VWVFWIVPAGAAETLSNPAASAVLEMACCGKRWKRAYPDKQGFRGRSRSAYETLHQTQGIALSASGEPWDLFCSSECVNVATACFRVRRAVEGILFVAGGPLRGPRPAHSSALLVESGGCSARRLAGRLLSFWESMCWGQAKDLPDVENISPQQRPGLLLRHAGLAS